MIELTDKQISDLKKYLIDSPFSVKAALEDLEISIDFPIDLLEDQLIEKEEIERCFNCGCWYELSKLRQGKNGLKLCEDCIYGYI